MVVGIGILHFKEGGELKGEKERVGDDGCPGYRHNRLNRKKKRNLSTVHSARHWIGYKTLQLSTML